MHKPLLVVPLLLAACTYPQFRAAKLVELELPAAGVARLDCTTHNGDIEVTAGEADDTIRLQAKLEVLGYTQAEADDNLGLMSVATAQEGDVLKVHGDWPSGALANRSPTVQFTLTVPARFALVLETHNGDVETRGTHGPLTITSHNGDIDGQVGSSNVHVDTHNGDITLATGGGVLDGEITTHNGTVVVTLAEQSNGWLEASTHNGRVAPPSRLQDATVDRHSLRCRLGNGDGKLSVTSHNGDIVFR